jgi:hypothetical protein
VTRIEPDHRHFVAYFHVTAFSHVSLGVHLSLLSPNIEIHLPFGFIRIGCIECCCAPDQLVLDGGNKKRRTFGYEPKLKGVRL